MKQLADRVAVVTGAASGIGRGLCIVLAEMGAHVAAVDVDGEGLDALAAHLSSSRGRVTTHVVDVSDADAVAALADEVVAEHGAVHLLVNNAGITIDGTFEQQSLDDWKRVVGVNLWGVVHGCQAFLPHLRNADQGHIVNVSSLFGIMGVARQSSYCATKYAVRGLSESLWEELRGSSVGLTVVHPGGVATNIVRSGTFYDGVDKARIVRMFDRMAMTPDRAARLIVRAVQRDQRRLIITPEAVLGDLVKRVSPVFGNGFLHRVTSRALGL